MPMSTGISLPIIKKVLQPPDLVFELTNLMTQEECVNMTEHAEMKGFQKSSVSGGGHGRTGREDPRTSSHSLIIDNDVANILWSRVCQHLQPDLSHVKEIYGLRNPYFHSVTMGAEWKPVGICERLRVYKYLNGENFPEHIDYKMGRDVIRSDGLQYRQQSFVSLVVYLNDDFQGGTTNLWLAHEGIHCRFLRDVEDKPSTLIVKPKIGNALLMDQNILHEGSPVEKQGVKYILRTDIIFERLKTSPCVSKTLQKRTMMKGGVPRMEQPGGGVIAASDWERIFESSCKNYAD